MSSATSMDEFSLAFDDNRQSIAAAATMLPPGTTTLAQLTSHFEDLQLNGGHGGPGDLSPVLTDHSSNVDELIQQNSKVFDTFVAMINGLAPKVEERPVKYKSHTECVPVPSSEHVAEIVGRQGCKIKALRAKTNTFIKTPIRGEEPIFVIAVC